MIDIKLANYPDSWVLTTAANRKSKISAKRKTKDAFECL